MKSVVYRVAIEGRDISSSIQPRLMNLSHSDKEGASSDTLDIVLDDCAGSIALPKTGVEIAVFYGWKSDGPPPLRFVGIVDEIRTDLDRSSGRTLTVRAQGLDAASKAKEESLRSWDDETFGTVIEDAAKDAGLRSVKVDPELAEIQRPYWFQGDESFIAFAERLAVEIGGTFKIQGQAVTITKRGAGRSPDGKPLPTIRAGVGENLISASLSPTSARPRFKRVRGRVYDREAARYKEVEVEVDSGDLETVKTIFRPLADEDEAKVLVEAVAEESRSGTGGGSIVIDGNGDASPEGPVLVVGVRPGVDGIYTIADVSHEISRGGWTTTLNVKKPDGEAGKDGRKAKAKTGSTTSSGAPTPTANPGPNAPPTDGRLKPESSRRLGFAGPTLQV